MNIDSLRFEYSDDGFHLSDLDHDPIVEFQKWFQLAQDCPDILEPNAMQLATATPQGTPSLRTVLLKGLNNNQFQFFTNYSSNKAKEIQLNPNVSLLLLWLPLERQVRIQGTASKLSQKESLAYFHSRPRNAQIGARASTQSGIIPNRSGMQERFEATKQQFEGKPIPLPKFWGGYTISPTSIEFWQGRRNRLHDRCLYKKESSAWSKQRLAP